MDSVSDAAVLSRKPRLTGVTTGLRPVIITLALTLAAILLMYSLWSSLGYKMLMLGLGWPHVILGFVFYFGAIVRGNVRTRIAFVMLVLLTLAIWTVHYVYDIAALIYIYFLYHAFRDDILVSVWKGARQGRMSHALDAGAIVLILMLLGLLIFAPAQDVYRNVRSLELSGSQISANGWTLVSFDPVADSRGREYYFFLQAPHTVGSRAFVTRAVTSDRRTDGEIRVNNEKWTSASDLIFQPYYAGEPQTGSPREQPATPAQTADEIPVLLTGGHRVGQTFKAERNNLAGIWLPIDRLNYEGETTRFVFRLSAPLFAYPFTQTNLRWAGIIALSLILFAWLLLRQRGSAQVWVYLVCMIALVIGLQAIFKTSNLAEQSLRFFAQFVLVFHYFLWYVITFNKYRGKSAAVGQIVPHNLYDRMLAFLRQTPQFPIAVVVLNLASLAGVAWYYQANAAPRLLYFFDYRFFLYFLAFHVTFSFKPTFLQSRM
jgi:hypothetical protein